MPWSRVQESKSKSELFYQLFIYIFRHILLTLGFNTCLNGDWNYRYLYRSNVTPFKWSSVIRLFLGLLASFVHARLILTSHSQP